MTSYMKELRTNTTFEKYLQKTKDATSVLFDDGPPAKRLHTAPPRLEDYVHTGPTEDRSEKQQQKLKRQYYEIIDLILSSFSTRFGQEGIKVLVKIEEMLINAANGREVNGDWEDMPIFCMSSFDKVTLKRELVALPTYVKLFNQENIPIKEVTMVSTLHDIMNSRESFKICLPNIHQLLLLYTTAPLSSATAERSFSTMRRLKTWLRASMTTSTLTNRMFAAIHKYRLDAVNTETIASEFVKKLQQRIDYFGKFE